MDRLRKVDSAFLLGDAIQVSCNTAQKLGPTPAFGARVSWHPVSLDDVKLPDKASAELPQLYLRGGFIVPVGPVTQTVDETPCDPLTLLIALNDKGTASGEMYEDSGNGHEHRTRNEFCRTRFSAAAVVTSAAAAGAVNKSSGKVVVTIERGVGGGTRRAQHVTTYVIRLLVRPSQWRALSGSAAAASDVKSSNESTVVCSVTVAQPKPGASDDTTKPLVIEIGEKELSAAIKSSASGGSDCIIA